MYMHKLEATLVRRLKRELGREVKVVAAPPLPVIDGLRSSLVYVHAAAFEDFGRLTLEGIPIARNAVGSGFFEERPGRIVINISCQTQAYE